MLSVAVATDERPLASVVVALSPHDRFEEYLQSRGLRQTDQRRFLVEQVFTRHEHFDADSLIENLPRKGHKDYVSQATVYRTLKEFVDAGLLHCFQLDGRSVYEHDYGYPQHDHLYCTQCRRLIEFQSETLSNLIVQVGEEHGFRVSEHRLIVKGTCAECVKLRRRKKRKQDLV